MSSTNPKKVAVLAVVAVGAVGYLAYSLLGLGDGLARHQPSAQPASSPEGRESSEVLVLRGDPFTHPLLLQKRKDAEAAATAAMAPPQNASIGGIDGPWRVPEATIGTMPVLPLAQLPEQPKPAESTEASRNPREESRLTVRLTAVIDVKRIVALLSVNGKDSRPLSEGELVAPGWRLYEIGQDAIVVGNHRRRHRIRVGEEASL